MISIEIRKIVWTMLSCKVLGETKLKQQQKWFTGNTKIKCYEDLVDNRQWWPWDWFHCDCYRGHYHYGGSHPGVGDTSWIRIHKIWWFEGS